MYALNTSDMSADFAVKYVTEPRLQNQHSSFCSYYCILFMFAHNLKYFLGIFNPSMFLISLLFIHIVGRYFYTLYLLVFNHLLSALRPSGLKALYKSQLLLLLRELLFCAVLIRQCFHNVSYKKLNGTTCF